MAARIRASSPAVSRVGAWPRWRLYRPASPAAAKRWRQVPTKPRLHARCSQMTSQVRPSASSRITRARRAASARPVRLVACFISSMRSRFVRVIVFIMNTIIVYKWMLQPMVCGTDLLESEIGDLLKRLPKVETIQAEESHKLCDEVIDMPRNTTRRMQDRMKSIADYVNLMRTPLTFSPCTVARVAEQVLSVLGRV